MGMMGTTDEALPIVMSPQMDAMFVGFGLCNAVIAALLYPQSFSSKETVKFQQTVAAVSCLASSSSWAACSRPALWASRVLPSKTSRTCRWLPATRRGTYTGRDVGCIRTQDTMVRQ